MTAVWYRFRAMLRAHWRAVVLLALLAGAAGGVTGAQRPSDIIAYERVRSTPIVLAAVLAVLAIGTVAHALTTSVRRRRRDRAVLKTLGSTRRQVSGAVAWQATTIAARVAARVRPGVVLRSE